MDVIEAQSIGSDVNNLHPIDRFVREIKEHTGEAVNDFMAPKCMTAILQKVGADSFVQYVPLLMLMLEMVKETPKPSGNPITDDENWSDFVDVHVRKFLELTGKKQLSDFFADESILLSVKGIYGLQDLGFLHDNNKLMMMLKSTRNMSGLVEMFLTTPLDRFRDHSITLKDRYGYYLPEFISKLGISPALRFVGDSNVQPALNLKGLRVVGFSLYDGSGYQKPVLSENPMERMRTKFHNLRYYGGGNPVLNGLPVSKLDEVGFRHDFGYHFAGGYNTPYSANVVDKALVDEAKQLLASGKVKPDDPDYDVLVGGIKYFSMVDVK